MTRRPILVYDIYRGLYAKPLTTLNVIIRYEIRRVIQFLAEHFGDRMWVYPEFSSAPYDLNIPRHPKHPELMSQGLFEGFLLCTADMTGDLSIIGRKRLPCSIREPVGVWLEDFEKTGFIKEGVIELGLVRVTEMGGVPVEPIRR